MIVRFPTRNPTKCIEAERKRFTILSAMKFNMFKLQLNKCVHSKTCLDEGFSQHIPTHGSKESYDCMINHFKRNLTTDFFADVWPLYKMMGQRGVGWNQFFPLAFRYALAFVGTNFSLKRMKRIVQELIFISFKCEFCRCCKHNV